MRETILPLNCFPPWYPTFDDMQLTIITINWNNQKGLVKTLNSVLSQRRDDFEYVLIDGGSTDGSVETIQEFAEHFGNRLRWVSEPDKGIYNAMNKGIRMASGGYLQFLNSGDCLVSENVIGEMYNALEINGFPPILYGNMLKDMPNGILLRDKCFAGQEISLLGFYIGTLNHSSAYIRRDLFEKYGLYDESLKIVSDWKWYLQAIIFGGEKPVYANIDVSLFDMNGISETNKELNRKERRIVLEQIVPSSILIDYDNSAFPIMQMKRLKRHSWAYRLVWFLERCLFKIEKWQIRRINEMEFK